MPDVAGTEKKQKANTPSKQSPTTTGLSQQGNSPAYTPSNTVQRAQIDPRSLAPADVIYLQRTIGNRATQQILARQSATRASAPAQVQRTPARPSASTEGQHRAHPGQKQVLNHKIQNAPVTIQRLLKTKLPTRWYRRAGGSQSSKVNQQIDLYNANVKSGKTTAEENEKHLGVIRKMLKSVDRSKKASALGQIRLEIASEIRGMESVRDVMALSRERARLQEEDPKQDKGTRVDPGYAESLEVLHATNPLKSIGKGKTVGDSLSQLGEIRNIHQIGMSMVGSNTDGPKRKNAEIGLFYPQRYRRGSFNRKGHENKSDTKGLRQDMLPPESVLPKYGAINFTKGAFGAFSDKDVPLHFAINPKVLQERTTATTSDSLREWVPNASGFEWLQNRGMIPKGSDGAKSLPEDDKPWNTGPVGVFSSEHSNFGQLLDTTSSSYSPKGKYENNPSEYVEAQVHGELLIDRDISHVRANFAKLFGNPRFASLYGSFKSSKKPIKWYYWTDEKKEGNLVSQEWQDGEERIFNPAWKRAEKIWNDNNKALKKRMKKTAMYEGNLEAGNLIPAQATKLYALWGELHE